MMGPSDSPVDYKSLVKSDRIHASLYREPRIFEDEMERIFHRGWVFVGHESEIPGPGDFVTRTIGTQPVIIVRTRDERVAVLAEPVRASRHHGVHRFPRPRADVRVSVPRLDVRRGR